MTEINRGRWTAEIEGDFVVFIIGARANRRSFEHLEAFARNTDDPHLSAWRNYWKRVGKDDRAGIWHETFLVRDGEYEAVYANMPTTGLGTAGTVVPVSESSMARDRIRTSASS
jgi:hypothetical protein